MTDRIDQEQTSGCGVNGCLYGAVVLFALLLVGMLILVAVRFSRPPESLPGPQSSPAALSLSEPSQHSTSVRAAADA